MKDWKTFIEEATEKYGCNFGVVYRIYCQETGISYVGQTTDLISVLGTSKNPKNRRNPKPTRILSHYNALRKGCHSHKELQECFNSHPEAFYDEPIEVVETKPKDYCGKKYLSEREKYWQEFYSATEAKLKSDQLHYRLKTDTLKQLKEAGAINNQALVFFILKLQNPWCDKPLKIEPLQIAVEWDIPESSVYEAVLKLKTQGLLKVTQSTMTIEWSDCQSEQSEVVASNTSEKSESFWDSRIHSEKSESILKNQNQLRDIRIHSEISESESPEAIPSKSPANPHTFQTYKEFIHTLSEPERERFLNFVQKKIESFKNPIASIPDWLASTDSTGSPRFEDYYQQFTKSPHEVRSRELQEAEALRVQLAKEKIYWEQHPQFEAWVQEIAIAKSQTPFIEDVRKLFLAIDPDSFERSDFWEWVILSRVHIPAAAPDTRHPIPASTSTSSTSESKPLGAHTEEARHSFKDNLKAKLEAKKNGTKVERQRRLSPISAAELNQFEMSIKSQ